MAVSLQSATTGKIAGVAMDVETGKALPGVNIAIKGTIMGAGTDAEGRYYIINVPVGTYTVEASMMGYKKLNKTEVSVSVDVTTELNFDLTTAVIEGDAVTVIALRPLIEKTLTQSKTTVDANELNNTLPVSGINDIVETAASTFHGYIRGGRKHETKVLIDGVDVSDTYYSAGAGAFGTGDVGHNYIGYRASDADELSAQKIASGNVQELTVFAGTFTAEYPTASAGIVNVVTRTGGDKYHGKLFVRGTPLNEIEHFGSNPYWMKDDLLSPDGEIIERGYFSEKALKEGEGATPEMLREAALYSWTEAGAKDDYYYDAADSVGLGRSYEIEGVLSGPLPFAKEKGSFFLLGRYENRRTSPMPFDVQKHVVGNLKINYNLNDDMRLTGYAQLTDGGKLFNFVNWKYNSLWAYNMNSAPRYKDLATMFYLKYTHTISPSTYYELQVSQSNKMNEIGYTDDDGDGSPSLDDTGDFITFDDINDYKKYVGAHTQTDSVRDSDGNYLGEYTWLNPRNADGYIWADADGNGENDNFGDVTKRVFFYDRTDPGTVENRPTFYSQDGFYRTAYPTPMYHKTTRNVTTIKGDLTSQINFNHQIKSGFQFRQHGIDINHKISPLGSIGTVYPYNAFDTDIAEYNPREMAVYVQDRIEYKGMILNIGVRMDGYDNDTEEYKNDFHPYVEGRSDNANAYFLGLEPDRGDKVGWKWFFSPRIGVSHPVSDKMAMHYSFGKFIQYPNFASLYENYSLGNIGHFNLPTKWVDQEPMSATAYEMGLQYAPLSDISVDVSIYYRDVENYSSIQYQLTPGYSTWNLGWNSAWGNADSRGVEMTVTKRPGKWWSGRLTYTYSYIKESVATPNLTDKDQRTNFSTEVDENEYEGIPWELAESINYRMQNVVTGANSGNRFNNPLAGGYDRTHRVSASVIGYLPYGFQISSVAEAMSGFKYWPLENMNNDPYFDISPTLEVGPMNYNINVRVTEVISLGSMQLRIFGEVRNLTNKENILAINLTPFNADQDQRIFEKGRDMKPDTGDEESDPEGVFKLPHDRMGRMLYGPARQFWMGLEVSF